MAVKISIKISFLKYPYDLVSELIRAEFFDLASILDIACMKCSAIIGRAKLRDYIDLYYVLKILDLANVLVACKTKFPNIDTNLILKGLTYFEDIDDDPIKFRQGFLVSKQQVRETLQNVVKNYYLINLS